MYFDLFMLNCKQTQTKVVVFVTRILATLFRLKFLGLVLKLLQPQLSRRDFHFSLFDLHQRGQTAAAAAFKFKSTRMLKTESERETLIIPRFLIFLIRFSCCLFKVSPPSSLALLCFVSVCLV